MNRTGALIALAIAAVVGLAFGVYPDLDLKISGLLYDPGSRASPWLAAGFFQLRLRECAASLIALIVAPACLALIAKLVLPRARMWLPGRAAVLMVTTLALAPGLVANVILKDQWGRPRPIDVTAFKGQDEFVPWWDPRGSCPKNCSFIAGEPSGAFWTLAPAMLAPPGWRALATAAALAFGAAIGFLRMAGGGHFFTDVAFSGVVTFLLIWIVHGLIYRWRSTRISDEMVERTLETMAQPLQRGAAWVAARMRGEKAC